MENSEIERIDNFFLDETQLKKQPYIVYRFSIDGGRVYFTITPDEEVKKYISLTTLTKNTLPTPEALIKWIASLGYDAAKAYMNERANYGTIMHLAFGEFLTKKEWNFDLTHTWLNLQIAKGAAKSCDIEKTAYELNRDMACFAQFCVDYKVKPIAIELVLVSEKDGYATLIDLVAKITIEEDGLDYNNPYKSGVRKGEPREVKVRKEIISLVNFKSGKKGFYEEHSIQLELEKRLFQENYPEVQIDKVYNFAPKDFRGAAPTYSFKDQSDSLDKEKADALITIAKIELMKRTPKETVIAGKVKLGETPKIEEVDFEEYLRNRAKETLIF